MKLLTVSLALILFLYSLPASGVVLSVDDCIEMALESDQSVIAARYALEEAHGNLVYARSGFFPTLSLDASITKLSTVPQVTIPAGLFGPDEMRITMGTDEQVSLGATLVQPIWYGGRVYNAYKLSKTAELSAGEELRLARSRLVYDVRQAFYDLLLTEELIAVTAESIERAHDHLSVAEKRYQVGLAPKFEMLRAQVDVINLGSQLIQLENLHRVQERALRQLINLDEDKALEIVGRMEYVELPMTLEECLDEASANRAELAQMEYQLDILERNISLSKSGDNPLISLIGSYQNTSDRFFDSEHYQGVFSATLNLSWPLWDSFATSGQVMAARAQMRQIEMGREQLEEGIILEVEALYRQMESSRQMMVAQEANIALAEEAVDMVEAQYKVGLATYLDVTDSQLTLRQAEIGYMQALHDYLLAVYELYRAMGWEE